jgi:nucleoside-diphosphate-sugar epimerase
LVTGCAGFIGSHLAERLIEGDYEVVGIDCFSDYYPRKIKERSMGKLMECDGFHFIKADITEKNLAKLLNGVDYIFHQASQAGVRASWGKSFKIYTDNNILATQMLLEAAKDGNIKKFVYASSSSVYGDTLSLPMKETDTPRPISPYGVSKLAGEHLCYLYWKNFGVKTTSLRYFTVYGPGQRPDMAFHRFIKAMLYGGKITIYGDGKQTRDFTYVSDIVEANLLAADSDVEGEVFNIGGGSRISLMKTIHILEEITDREAKIEYIEKQKGDVRDTYADVGKAKAILGYSPEVEIEEGLRKEVEWIKKITVTL